MEEQTRHPRKAVAHPTASLPPSPLSLSSVRAPPCAECNEAAAMKRVAATISFVVTAIRPSGACSAGIGRNKSKGYAKVPVSDAADDADEWTAEDSSRYWESAEEEGAGPELHGPPPPPQQPGRALAVPAAMQPMGLQLPRGAGRECGPPASWAELLTGCKRVCALACLVVGFWLVLGLFVLPYMVDYADGTDEHCNLDSGYDGICLWGERFHTPQLGLGFDGLTVRTGDDGNEWWFRGTGLQAADYDRDYTLGCRLDGGPDAIRLKLGL